MVRMLDLVEAGPGRPSSPRYFYNCELGAQERTVGHESSVRLDANLEEILRMIIFIDAMYK